MNTNYPMRVYTSTNGDSFDWVVEFPDLQGCIGVGKTVEEAIKEANIFKELWLNDAIESKEAIPVPNTLFTDEFSGKFNLRIPKSLHRDLALQAEVEGVSLNTLCTTFLTKGMCNTNFKDTVKDTIEKSIIVTPYVLTSPQ